MVNLTVDGSIPVKFQFRRLSDPSSTLPNSIIGEDYLRYYSDGTPESAWGPNYMQHFTKWKCNTARLAFAFADAPVSGDGTHCHSMYDEDKMDRVIEIFDSYDIKVILDNHNWGDHAKYVGSTAWVNNWKAIATHYKGDSRIAGFNIFNEPGKATWATSGPLGSIDTKEEFIQVCGYLIDQIRAIDPTRTIYFPCCYGMGIGLNDPYTLNNLLISYGILDKGNIVIDIGHPYYFEGAYDLGAGYSPEQFAIKFENEIIIPSVELYGSENCWIGETYAARSPPYTANYQVRFLTAMINACIKYDVGLQVWAYFGKTALQNEALMKSNY